MKNPYQPDFRPFLTYVEEELEYLEAFDLASDYRLSRVAGALGILQEYLTEALSE